MDDDGIDWDQVDLDALDPPKHSPPLSVKEPVTTQHVAVTPAGAALHDHVTRRCLEVYGFEPKQMQHDVISALHENRDVLVLWATGCGKSICFQLPALMGMKTCLVISPLISLMEDQVTSINRKCTSGRPPAAFLGSAQMNGTVYEDAIRGVYRLVYVAPETATKDHFLASIKPLYDAGGLSCIAIDEAHCASEWGHDFRPSFRDIPKIREAMPNLPLVALTATATPRVQDDIIKLLEMKNPFISKSSFDRPNLCITVQKKVGSDVKPILDLIRGCASGSSSSGGTIVYVPSRKGVDSMAESLQTQLGAAYSVGAYHAEKSAAERRETHIGFLTGKVKVIVATVAFGMGIDKPDVRNVIHWGPPQTMEGYIQQIGRGGRDGLKTQCLLLYSDSEFSGYKSEFYINKLSAAQLAVIEASTDTLQRYANSRTECRRLAVLRYFGDDSEITCTNCDICQSHAMNPHDATRDFTAIANVLLYCVQCCPMQGITKLKAEINRVLSLPAPFSGIPHYLHAALRDLSDLGTCRAHGKNAKELHVDLLPLLLSTQPPLLVRTSSSIKLTGSNYQKPYDIYSLSQQASVRLNTAARNGIPNTTRIMLPVPDCIRKIEAAQAAKRKQALDDLQKIGVHSSQVPVEELEMGDGKEMKIHFRWAREMGNYQSSGRHAAAQKMQDAQQICLDWRDAKAQEFTMAPVSVLSDSQAKQIALNSCRTTHDLVGLGVRIQGVEELSARLEAFYASFPEDVALLAAATVSAADGTQNVPITLPDIPYKKPYTEVCSKTTWKEYTALWHSEMTIEQIAARPPGGKKPVQGATVLSHVLTSLLYSGQPAVDLARLARECADLNNLVDSVPTVAEWKTIKAGYEVSGLSYEKPEQFDPKMMGDLAGAMEVPALSAACAKQYKDRTEKDLHIYQYWSSKIKWYRFLMAAGVPVDLNGGPAPVAGVKRVLPSSMAGGSEASGGGKKACR